MPKRVLMWALILALIGALLYAYSQWTSGPNRVQTPKDALPLDVQRLIPLAWDLSIGGHVPCDFDGDGKNEWLVMYRYDSVSPRLVNQPKDAKASRGLIGAAIYDARLDPQAQGNPSQYASTSITPYRLLPDFTDCKGQGYLGESKVTTIFIPPVKDGTCKADEIVFLGYSDGDQQLPTRLSIFRWFGQGAGYRAVHFTGNARVDTPDPLDGSKRITQITTYNRLNDRSLLCESRTFKRDASQLVENFTEQPSAFTVDYCFGPPPDPMYPEGAVVALLRGSKPTKTNDKVLLPPGESYMLPAANLPDGLKPPSLIQSVAQRAAASLAPGGGHSCESEFGSGGRGWQCGRQVASVETEVPVGGVYRRVTWQVISVAREDVVDDVHWRIEQVTP